jgi:LysB family phage lysis regulatory protein
MTQNLKRHTKIMQNLLKSKLLPWLLLLLCLSFGYLRDQLLSTKNKQLQASNLQLKNDKQALIEIIDYKNNELLELSDQYQANEQKLIEQKNQLQAVDTLNRQYQQQLEQLINENKQLRMWSDTDLPDVIKRLYTRPEIKGSEDYQNWLSSRNALLSSHE